MTNSQEYALHVLNELMVASYAARLERIEIQRAVPGVACVFDTANREFAERLRAEIDAIHGHAADSNSIVAAAFAAMRTHVSDPGGNMDESALQRRIDSAIADHRLPLSLREGLARFSEGARRCSAALM